MSYWQVLAIQHNMSRMNLANVHIDDAMPVSFVRPRL